ncbi:hypothetical protein GTO27_03845 [Candidatus Bathyarchaeota archaeon]|nr:hypothetical protein [Candidatus Bathyarchaeota archaeon]
MPGRNGEFSIVQFSDTHITSGSSFNAIAFIRAAEQVNHLDIDYLIHSGDVTERGTREDYELARQLLSTIKKKMIYIIGNHDARNVGYELFGKYIGSIEPVFMDDRVMIAGFDSTIPDRDEGRFGARHILKLKRILRKEGEDRTKIVVFHHHLLPIPKAGRERSMIVDAGDVLKAVLDYNVDLVLNGHRHSPNIFRVEDTVVINSGTLSHYKTRAGDYHSYNIIKIAPKRVVDVTVRSVEVPTKRKLVKKLRKGEKLIRADGERIARIAQISDTHFTSSSEFLSKIFGFAVTRVNQLNPDLVIHCGDVTHDGLHESYELAAREMRKVAAPRLILPGPHDFMHLGDLLFQERIGELSPVYKAETFSVYGVNSSQFDEMEGLIGRSHLNHLVSELSKLPENHVKIVAFHHHILPLPHTREKYLIEDSGDVLKRLLDIKVDMILTGHRHIGHALKIDETVVVNANTLCSRRVQGRYGNTFNLIDLLSNGTVIISEIGVATGMRRILGIYTIPTFTSSKKSEPKRRPKMRR